MDTPDFTTLKRCSKCGEFKPLEAFHKHKNSKDGLKSACRACRAEEQKRFREANRDKIKATQSRYYEANKSKCHEASKRWAAENVDRVRETRRRYRNDNHEKLIEYERRWRDENPEKGREKQRRYYENNPDAARESVRRYRANNPDKVRERAHRWRAQNPDAARAIQTRRRARTLGTTGTHSAADLRAIRAGQTDKQGRIRCWWCGAPIETTPHIDHKTALAAGGTNGPENLCYACPKCNRRKNTKTPSEFAGRLL